MSNSLKTIKVMIPFSNSVAALKDQLLFHVNPLLADESCDTTSCHSQDFSRGSVSGEDNYLLVFNIR